MKELKQEKKMYNGYKEEYVKEKCCRPKSQTKKKRMENYFAEIFVKS